MRPVGESETAEEYLDFGERQAADSPCFTDWALGVARDDEVLSLLESLPAGKRQPNLVFAAARWHGALPGPYDELRRVLRDDWAAVRETILSRATQTNEVGRCATLLPVLASLPGPLALLEVGCSAGLCLFPDRYSYRYTGETERTSLDPHEGRSSVVLQCNVSGGVPLPAAMPEVVWRGGVDLNPLDVRDDTDVRWLQTLVWPEHDDRRALLTAAVELARADPPALVRGNLLDTLPALVEQVPPDATLVVFHSAVIAYLSAAERDRFVRLVGTLPGHWVSNEGATVLPSVAASVGEAPDDVEPLAASFVLGLDGVPLAWTHGHGRSIHWLDPARRLPA